MGEVLTDPLICLCGCRKKDWEKILSVSEGTESHSARINLRTNTIIDVISNDYTMTIKSMKVQYIVLQRNSSEERTD